MTNTQQLLERCARVMGLEVVQFYDGLHDVTGDLNKIGRLWNPLTSIADAADMVIKMKVDVVWYGSGVRASRSTMGFDGEIFDSFERFGYHPTEQEAYCYAVCQVVAQMGGE